MGSIYELRLIIMDEPVCYVPLTSDTLLDEMPSFEVNSWRESHPTTFRESGTLVRDSWGMDAIPLIMTMRYEKESIFS